MADRTLIVASEVKWTYMRTRKQYILSAWPEGWRIVFLEPIAFGRSNSFRPRRDGRVTYVTVPFLKAGTTSAPYEALTRTRAGRVVLGAIAWAWSRVMLAAIGAGDSATRAILVANVLAWPAVRGLRRARAVYDMNDDPTGFHAHAPWVGEYARETLSETDAVVACSSGLARRARENGARAAVVVGNGVDARALAGDIAEAPALAALTRPRVGYVGAVAPWFDFALIEAVARAIAPSPLVLVGPVQASVADRFAQVRARCANVVAIGEVPYTEVAAHVQALDVCLIPFVRGPLTDVLNPNKLYEYLARGRTVVTLDYSDDITALGDALYIARTAEEFVDAVRRACDAPREPARLRAIAAANAWQSKAIELERVITQAT